MKTFETNIFPFKFCIAEFKEIERVTETFVDCDGNKISLSDNVLGVVIRAKYKSTGKICSLIMINKEEANIGTVAHEASHSAEDLLENIGVYHNASTSEVYSYVIGYIAQKIYETIWE